MCPATAYASPTKKEFATPTEPRVTSKGFVCSITRREAGFMVTMPSRFEMYGGRRELNEIL